MYRPAVVGQPADPFEPSRRRRFSNREKHNKNNTRRRGPAVPLYRCIYTGGATTPVVDAVFCAAVVSVISRPWTWLCVRARPSRRTLRQRVVLVRACVQYILLYCCYVRLIWIRTRRRPSRRWPVQATAAVSVFYRVWFFFFFNSKL